MQSTVWDCPQAPDTLLTWLHVRMATAKGVRDVQRTQNMLAVSSEGVQAWTVVVAVLLFPIGLLALLVKGHATLLMRAEPGESGGSRLYIDGAVSQGAKRRLVEVYGELFPVAVAA